MDFLMGLPKTQQGFDAISATTINSIFISFFLTISISSFPVVELTDTSKARATSTIELTVLSTAIV